jgi:nitrite reductase/ring-hydroxylating ferredoxin subunit
MALSSDDLAGLVDLDRGTVAGRAFTDDDIYEIELERVFARAWCFLCDTDNVPDPGDFVSTFTGEDPVAIVRQNDRTLRAMLNSCRHRGLQVCGPSGQAAQLTCGYHGWVYDLDGRLVGVTGGDEQFSRWARDRDLGLVPVTRTDEIGHLLFCSWDAEWAPVADDERPTLSPAIDAVRRGFPLVRHFRPMRVDVNWKLALEALVGITAVEGGVTLFPAFAALPSRDVVISLLPKGPKACELSVSSVSALSDEATTALRVAIDTRLEPEGPRAVPLRLKSQAAAAGCPDDQPISHAPPRHLDERATAEVYGRWLAHLTDETPLTGLIGG